MKMSEKWHWYVYIIECQDKTYYTGMTWKISARIDQHISRLGSNYTGKHGFKRLSYYEEFNDLESARLRELQIKGWNREKKENLINGNWHKDW
jgi:putative endonuclease